MNRELLLAGVLLSASMVLKIFSVVALCHAPLPIAEIEHDHTHTTIRREAHTTSRLRI